MTIKKFLTKTLASVTTGMLLMTSVASALAVNTPNKANAPNELIEMQNAATKIGLSDATIKSLEDQCIDGQKIINAVNSSISVYNQLKKIVYYDYENDQFPTPSDTSEKLYGYGSTPAYVRDSVTLTPAFTTALANCSVGPIKLSLDKTRPSYIPNEEKGKEYYATLYLSLNNKIELKFVDFPSDPNTNINPLSLPTDVDNFFTDYADFLTKLYNYYNAGGCYKTPTLPLDPNPRRPVRVPTAPVIINIINVNQFVYAGTFRTPSTVDPKAKKDRNVKNAVIYAEDRTLNCGDKFVFMQGVTAKDNGGKGKDLSKKVSIDGTINTYVAGKYVMTYKVTGANGVEVTKKVTITVKAKRATSKRSRTVKKYYR